MKSLKKTDLESVYAKMIIDKFSTYQCYTVECFIRGIYSMSDV